MTACTSTTSSQDTQKTLSLVEAPFWKYLEILRTEGFTSDADTSELFYVEMLTNIPRIDGEPYTKEQIMQTSFENLVKAVEAIVEQAEKEIKTGLNLPSVRGKMAVGAGADELTPEQLQYVMRRQLQLHEEEKLRQGL